MARVLSASRCTVEPENHETYIEIVSALAERVEARGQRLWLFQHTRDSRRFIEFTEAPAELAHRAMASRTAEELRLEKQLQDIADYASDAMELYEEVALSSQAT